MVEEVRSYGQVSPPVLDALLSHSSGHVTIQDACCLRDSSALSTTCVTVADNHTEVVVSATHSTAGASTTRDSAARSTGRRGQSPSPAAPSRVHETTECCTGRGAHILVPSCTGLPCQYARLFSAELCSQRHVRRCVCIARTSTPTRHSDLLGHASCTGESMCLQ